MYNGTLYTWGQQLSAWKLPQMRPTVLGMGSFGEGGCMADLNGDGSPEFVGYEGTGLGSLTYRHSPDWEPHTIDTEIEMHDCREALLFGRRGVLMVNRGMQVRFYERPQKPEPHWPYREIYSFYTASYQGDLVLHDVDRDGIPDILCGNYWINSPAAFDLPWRLFAINTYHETPKSALVRFVPLPDGRLWVFQSHLEKAQAILFERPDDPKQIWKEKRYGEQMQLSRVHGAVRVREAVIAGENNGARSRILLFLPGVEPQVLASGIDVVEIFGLGGSEFLLVGPTKLTRWRYRPRK
jgi:hypothetical protein